MIGQSAEGGGDGVGTGGDVAHEVGEYHVGSDEDAGACFYDGDEQVEEVGLGAFAVCTLEACAHSLAGD